MTFWEGDEIDGLKDDRKHEQVSKQTPTLDLSAIKSMIFARCSKLPPTMFPAPAYGKVILRKTAQLENRTMFSKRIVTPLVS